MQMFSGFGLPLRAVQHLETPIARTKVVRDPEMMDVATRAVETLAAAGPLQPTGAVRDALAAGRLVGSRDAATLDGIERLLSTGTPDPATARPVGSGMNDARIAAVLRDEHGESIDAVSKPDWAQGAQEQFGWKVGRAMGIDHRIAPVGRTGDGTAQIAFVEGTSLTRGMVRDGRSLQVALAQSHLESDVPLTTAEAAQAARVEAQLMGVFDYVLANSDRNGGNGIVDARSGVTLIDQGHVGRGQDGRSDVLVPGLRGELYGATNGTVDVDPAVVEFLGRRLDEPTLRAAHTEVFRGDVPVSTAGQFGRYNSFAASNAFIDGAVARLRHVVDTGSFSYGSPGETMGAPLRAVDEPPMRGGMRGARFGGGAGFGMM